MTLQEKIGALGVNTPAIKSLGLNGYNWWEEASSGVSNNHETTKFAFPITTAMSFNRSMWHASGGRAEVSNLLRKGQLSNALPDTGATTARHRPTVEARHATADLPTAPGHTHTYTGWVSSGTHPDGRAGAPTPRPRPAPRQGRRKERPKVFFHRRD